MLQEQLAADLKDAMRARDDVRRRTIRLVQSAITQKEKETGQGLSEEDAMAVLQKQIKQRRDSVEQFEAAGRQDLAAKEREELDVLEEYQPKQLTDDEIDAAVRAIIEETGAASMQDLGRVMGQAMQRLRGRADGRRVQQSVRTHLQNG